MRTLLLVPLSVLFGCAHGGAKSTEQAPPQAATEQAPPQAVTEQPAPSSKVAATTPAEVACPPARVHFAFDSAELSVEDQAALDRSADCLKDNQRQKVSIQGNADERGSNEYNKALGERRAQAVESYLTSRGVSTAQLATFSFGEENPLCAQSDEECWKRNRRAAIEPSCRM